MNTNLVRVENFSDLNSKMDLYLYKTNNTNPQIYKISILDIFFPVSQTEIDFGSLPVAEMEFTILDANVTATSKIIASVAYDAPTNKDLDELEMDDLQIKCGQAAAGLFKMFVRTADGTLVYPLPLEGFAFSLGISATMTLGADNNDATSTATAPDFSVSIIST